MLFLYSYRLDDENEMKNKNMEANPMPFQIICDRGSFEVLYSHHQNRNWDS